MKEKDFYVIRYPTVMFTTGPMFLTSQATNYCPRQSIDILSPELYGKYVHNSSQALFRHLKGLFTQNKKLNIIEYLFSILASSWHGNDASMIKSIYRHRYIVLGVFIILLLIVGLSIWSVRKYYPRKYSLISNANDQKYQIESSKSKYKKILHFLIVNFMFVLLFCFNRLE